MDPTNFVFERAPGSRRAWLRRRIGTLVAAAVVAALLPLAAGSAATTVGHQAHSHDGFGAGEGGAITGEKPESKLWFHDGVWWAAMVSPAEGGDHTVHRLDDTTWTDTGVVVDEPTGRADALVVGDTLFLTGRNTSRLTRLSYTGDGSGAGDGSWAVDSGFPVAVPVGTTEALTIARDTTGRLWLAWTQDSQVKTASSNDGGSTWSTAATVPVGSAADVTADDIAAIVAFTDDVGPAIGVMWSNQNTSTQHFGIHRDGDALDEWTVESALSGPRQVDDHINLKSFEGRVYAVVKTAVKKTSADPLIRLLVRDTDGRWSNDPVARGEERDTRPITVLQIDPAERQVYVFMTRNPADDRRQIVYKRTSIDNVGFPADATVFIYADRGVNDPTSLKSNATAASGIVVLATTSVDYWWNRIGGGASDPPPDEDPVQHTLTVDVTGSGDVTLDPDGGTYDEDTEVTLTATADSGWSFDSWSGDLTGDTNPDVLVMDSDKAVTAAFTEDDTEDDPPSDPEPAGDVTLAEVTTGGTTDTTSATTDSDVQAGTDQLYLAEVTTRPVAGTASVTGLGLTWEPLATQCAARSQTRLDVWTASGSPGSAGTVTAELSGAVSSAAIVVSRYTGVDLTDPVSSVTGANTLGVDGACSGGGDSASYRIALPTDDASLVHAAVTLRAAAHASDDPFTEQAEHGVGGGGKRAALAVVDGPVSDVVSGLLSKAVDWAAVAIGLRATS